MQTTKQKLLHNRSTTERGCMTNVRAVARTNIVVALASVILFGALGCSSASSANGPVNPNLPVGLPPAPPPASSNTYTGTQGPGLWSVSVDDTQQQFLYQAVTYPASPNVATIGSFLPIAGFMSLSSNGVPGGYAAEIPGRAVLLEPGSDTAAPVFAIEQDSCFPINGNVRFQYVNMPSAAQSNSPEYGSIEAQTSTDGGSWTFGAQAQYQLPRTMGLLFGASTVQPGTIDTQTSNLGVFPGTCTVSNGQATIAASPNVSSPIPTSNAPTKIVIGPTGFFLEDQSTGAQTQNAPDAFSLIGVIQPSSALVTSTITAAKYVGFLREAGNGGGAVTQPIGFGQIIAGAGTSITGGTFVDDDITQFQNSNIVITLGTQDPLNNGLYSLASITVPDPTNVCFVDPTTGRIGVLGGVPGVDQFGSQTCTFNGVAVVGNQENKYSIFITAVDVVRRAPMGIYMFQQQ
jgi:hypothetical protein